MTIERNQSAGSAPREINAARNEVIELTPARRVRVFSTRLNSRDVLVASSDDRVLQTLNDIVVHCGLRTLQVFTVGESRRIMNRERLCLVLCDDRLIDGTYEHILVAAERHRAKTPVIVVSPTGGWQDYLKAASAGAFDFLAYPPIPGELPRAICYALASRLAGISQESRPRIPAAGE
jgi:DNA-binding NtrC family response regulator